MTATVTSGFELVDVEHIRPSTYNPRKADPNRLDLIALSLRKLGFLLPLYATPAGEILSGHQRHHVAVDYLGWDRLPVARTKPMDLHDRKAVNIVFNRATNDMDRADTSGKVTAELEQANVNRLAADLPDVTGADKFPCMRLVAVATDDANRGRWVQYARNVAGTLNGHGIRMPVVARRSDLRVVNGLGRVEMYAERRIDQVPCVLIDDGHAQLAEAMLNLLSMDFAVEERYADYLRHNSFRRAMTRGYHKRGLPAGFHTLLGSKKAEEFDLEDAGQVRQWRAKYGRAVVDFGCGIGETSDYLRRIADHVTEFEPYRLDPDGVDVDTDLSRRLVRAFFDDIASGRRYSTVFCVSVLNSVPFLADRQHLASLIHGLCHASTKVVVSTLGTGHVKWTATVHDRNGAEKTTARSLRFPLDYEPGILLTDYGQSPKVKKHHTAEEVYDLFSPLFERVASRYEHSGNVVAYCAKPRPVDVDRLRDAIEFEFALPYPDGQRMGLVDEAKAAYGRRLGLTL